MMSVRPTRRRVLRWTLVTLAVWAAIAYLMMPMFWRHYEHLPAATDLPKTTRAPNGLPGDALNVALIGTEVEVQRAFAAAGWHPADPITLRSSLGIAASVLLDRPDPDAPVSTLLLFGRRQDLAFEQDLGASARQRNHVRLWRTEVKADDGRPLWVGAATMDRGVGLSHTTGQITHHIGPDIDAERDTLIKDLESAGWIVRRFAVTGVGPTLDGHNGGGDRYYTDGDMDVAVLADAALPDRQVQTLAEPTPVVIKNQFWTWIRPLLAKTDAAGASVGPLTPARTPP